AGDADHPVGLGLAVVCDQLVALFSERTVGRVQPFGPEQQVAVLEGVVAALLLVPADGIHGLGVVRGFTAGAASLGGGIVPVGCRDVVAVGAVFSLQLPVAVIGVGRGAAQHFQAFFGLVNHHVDDLGGFAQVLFQGQYVGVQRAEEETAVVLEAGDLGQVVRAVLVELLRVAGTARVLDLEQLAGVVEGPAVERAGEGGAVIGLATAQHGTAVAAGIDQRVQFTLLVARDDDWLAADV